MKMQFIDYPTMTWKLTSSSAIGGHFYIFRQSHFKENKPHYLKTIQWNSLYPEKEHQVGTSRPSVVQGDKAAMPYSKVILTQLPNQLAFCEPRLAPFLLGSHAMTLEEKEIFLQSHPAVPQEEIDQWKVQDLIRFTLTDFPNFLNSALKIDGTKESL